MQSRPAPNVPRSVFNDPIVQLAALCPVCALAALSPSAALAALSPVLRLFNPAVNPAAGLLLFTAPAAVTSGVQAQVSSRLTGVPVKVASVPRNR